MEHSCGQEASLVVYGLARPSPWEPRLIQQGFSHSSAPTTAFCSFCQLWSTHGQPLDPLGIQALRPSFSQSFSPLTNRGRREGGCPKDRAGPIHFSDDCIPDAFLVTMPDLLSEQHLASTHTVVNSPGLNDLSPTFSSYSGSWPISSSL